MCENKNELQRISKILDNCRSFDEWSEVNEVAEELCYKIATCSKRCGSDYCKGLQETF